MHKYPELLHLATKEQTLSARLLSLKQDLESSLRQKAKLQWLKLGDNNTSFFNQSIQPWNRANHISVLLENGREINDPTLIQQKF